MAVSKEKIEADLFKLLANLSNEESNLTPKNFSNGLALIIQEAILSATIVIPAGIPVTTTGGAGSTTIPVTASVS